MMLQNYAQLQKKAEEIRYNLVAMMDYAGSGHPGGSLSIVEIMTALYYGGILKQDTAVPEAGSGDRFVMSKGHASPTLYVILADLGCFPPVKLKEFDADDSMLPKHCNRLKTPGVEASTGALGQGFSMALGMAMAERIEETDSSSIYCILGDGECQSGEIWEAAMAAAKYKLDNFKAIVDDNGLQIDGDTKDIMPLGSLREKWEAFGWHVQECDGHDMQEVMQALEKMNEIQDRPQVLIAKTTKGKGVSFMENEADWHSRKMTREEGAQALNEIKKHYAALGYGDITSKNFFLTSEELENLECV